MKTTSDDHAEAAAGTASGKEERLLSLNRTVNRILARALAECNGDEAQAARRIGIDVATFRQWWGSTGHS
jgi:DNA-binding NtrC family response regulator